VVDLLVKILARKFPDDMHAVQARIEKAAINGDSRTDTSKPNDGA
jgi:hypothetical protein